MDYHSDFDSVSKTMLNLFCKSPVEYHLTYVTREMEPWSPSMPAIVGTICHACLLEGKEVRDLVAVYPSSCLKSNGHINPTPAEAFRANNPGLIHMKEGDVYEIEEVLEAMRGSLLGTALTGATHMEQRFDAELHGVKCRCKPDIVCDMADYVLAYDLKFMEDPSPSQFHRSAKKLRYWLQDAHYSKVLAEHYKKPVVFRFFACETQLPFRVQPYWYDPRSREIAMETHERKLKELAEAIRTDTWEDGWPSEVTMDAWDLSEEDQLVEFGENDDAS